MHLFILLTLSFSVSINSLEWGQTGHRVVGLIAENHLTIKAKDKINFLLDGNSLANVSTYADDIKSEKKYDYISKWHYINIPLDKKFDEIEREKDGDIIYAINKCIEVLKDPKYNKKEKSFHLKLLVHFVGDIHQPMHLGVKGDRGGNDIKIFWFGNITNLHRLWDTQIIESHNMSFTELANDLAIFSTNQIENEANKPIDEWVEETRVYTRQIYLESPPNSKLGYEYRYKNLPVIKSQLYKAGIRLASILNKIFG
ncbi:MAG: S1/P1 Nuclease [Flavobacteriaceae bacterium]|nr:S1/P1 Nuclease [Flavobacteriaceae bacterium]|tara:strand:+ start:240 stop:1007 length:768 start_codon:yes stop_codon:yes gene_type:complete